MKNTAVEWLYNKFSTCTSDEMVGNINNWFEQAKEMEKEQSLKMLPYDLNALADEYANDMSCDDGTTEFDFKAGFQKALELLTFKSE